MNAPIDVTQAQQSKKRKREDILEDFDELLDEIGDLILVFLHIIYIFLINGNWINF